MSGGGYCDLQESSTVLGISARTVVLALPFILAVCSQGPPLLVPEGLQPLAVCGFVALQRGSRTLPR